MSSRVFNPFEELKTKSILETLGLLPRTLAFVFRASPVYFLISTSTGFVQAGLSALLLWMGKVVIDRVTATIGVEFEWLYLLTPMFVLIGLQIFQSLLASSESLVTFMVREKVHNQAHSQLLHKATSLDLAFYEAPKFYDRLYQARRHIHNLHGVIFNVLALLRQFFTLGAMFGLLTVLHPLAIVVLFATISPRVLFEGYSAGRQFDLDVELTRNYRITSYFQSLMLKRENIKEIRIFGLHGYLIDKFFKFRELVIKALLRLNIHFLKLETSLDVLAMIGLCLVWIYAVYKAGVGNMTIGDLFMVFGAAQSCRWAIESLLSNGGMVFQNSLFLTRFFELLDLEPRTVEGSLEPPRTEVQSVLPSTLRRGIEFHNVSFRYPGTEDWILRDISFEIPARSKLAIVGENGAGKTTLIKLISRFYDPVEGHITLDRVDYRDLNLEDMRRNITVVFQDFARYDISVADNIGVGEVEYLNDNERIQSSAKKGGSHETAIKLPNKYETVLGRTFEEGVDLSGGEWQNLAISRAFMSDAQLFILDEPTAALDPFKEAEIYERFANLTKNRTVVLVSHRFSTVRMADLIVVVEEGRVIEKGSHEELIQLNGKYRQMFDAQAERYR